MVCVALLSNPKSTGNRQSLPRVRTFCANNPDIFHYEVEHVDQIGEALKIDAGTLDVDEPLETYGIDSVIVGLVNRSLQVHFEVGSTLLYEHRTIRGLARYLMQTQQARLRDLFAAPVAARPPEAPPAAAQRRRSPRATVCRRCS